MATVSCVLAARLLSIRPQGLRKAEVDDVLIHACSEALRQSPAGVTPAPEPARGPSGRCGTEQHEPPAGCTGEQPHHEALLLVEGRCVQRRPAPELRQRVEILGARGGAVFVLHVHRPGQAARGDVQGLRCSRLRDLRHLPDLTQACHWWEPQPLVVVGCRGLCSRQARALALVQQAGWPAWKVSLNRDHATRPQGSISWEVLLAR